MFEFYSKPGERISVLERSTVEEIRELEKLISTIWNRKILWSLKAWKQPLTAQVIYINLILLSLTTKEGSLFYCGANID